jgi:Trypsin-co-occurring domain 1
MTKLTPIELDDHTIIFIESTEDAIAPPIKRQPSEESDEEESPVTRGALSSEEVQRQTIQSFQAIERTIRAYTSYSLSAFKNLAIADIDKVTLRFGIEIGGEAGIPYITKGTAKSNLNIEVECSFPKRSDSAIKKD